MHRPATAIASALTGLVVLFLAGPAGAQGTPLPVPGGPGGAQPPIYSKPGPTTPKIESPHVTPPRPRPESETSGASAQPEPPPDEPGGADRAARDRFSGADEWRRKQPSPAGRLT